MAVLTKNPLRMVGGCINSGNINTGEVQTVRGGGQKCGVWSGSLSVGTAVGFNVVNSSGGQVLLVSGQGRLNSILPHINMQSGQPVYFYDAVAIVQSGTTVSGQIILASIPATYQGSWNSGYPQVLVNNGQPFNVDAPFFSGLCASILSGAPGFTVSYTPDTEPAFG